MDEDIIPDIRQVTFRKCTSTWEMPEQKLSHCNLTYLIRGESRYTVNDEAYDLAAGSLLFLPRGRICQGITFPGRLMHCFSVDFDLRNAKNRSVTLPFPVSSAPGLHDDIIHMFYDLTFSWQNKEPGHHIKSRGLLLHLIYRFLELLIFTENTRTGDSRITRVIHYIATHYAERITVKLMAKMAGLNPAYFGMLFREEMGMSFNRYLIQTRVKNAADMLSSGEYKVSDVAETCGFTDMSHFYKQFKLIKGFAPSHCLPKKF
jgi:AraC-like DNA-binding protein